MKLVFNPFTRKFDFVGTSGGSTSIGRKAGIVLGASFSGNPKKYAVVFATPFASANYAISVLSEEGRGWTFEAKTNLGFTINANANKPLTGEVDWVAQLVGES